MRELSSAQEDLEDYLQALDEDLYAVESVLFGPEEEEGYGGEGGEGVTVSQPTVEDVF
ncbi:hypothetical protein [Desulfothermobacter acidiphilus]|uniref:hypothetical protein n=1 Tax=Desulfothermobacter acidiphilus TaxID=1938353 RepID=UPI003F89A70A